MIKVVSSNVDKVYFVKVLERLMLELDIPNLPTELSGYPRELELYIETIYSKTDEECFCNSNPFLCNKPKQYQTPTTNKVLIAFSGGKDSVSTVIKARQIGLEPIIYYLKGINRGLPNEQDATRILAKKLDVELVEREVRISGKGEYFETPVKNQYILACMVDYGIIHGINNFSMGIWKNSRLIDKHFDYDLSDAVEMTENITPFFKSGMINYKFHYILSGRSEAYDILFKNRPDLLPDISSCLMQPFRKKPHRKNVEKKYSLTLLPNRCGVCQKCAAEYICLCLDGITMMNKEYFAYCLTVLRRNMKILYGNTKDVDALSDTAIINTWFDPSTKEALYGS